MPLVCDVRDEDAFACMRDVCGAGDAVEMVDADVAAKAILAAVCEDRFIAGQIEALHVLFSAEVAGQILPWS